MPLKKRHPKAQNTGTLAFDFEGKVGESWSGEGHASRNCTGTSSPILGYLHSLHHAMLSLPH